MVAGFRLGDFEFPTGDGPFPMSRREMRPDRPILGALPPPWLAGCVRESKQAGPAAELWTGDWRGHGEPAYTVFDVMLSGSEWLEIAAEEGDSGIGILMARPAGSSSDWTVLYDLSWFNGSQRPAGPQRIPAERGVASPGPTGSTRLKAALGFEYPIDCTSVDEVSWIAVAFQEDGQPAFWAIEQETM